MSGSAARTSPRAGDVRPSTVSSLDWSVFLSVQYTFYCVSANYVDYDVSLPTGLHMMFPSFPVLRFPPLYDLVRRLQLSTTDRLTRRHQSVTRSSDSATKHHHHHHRHRHLSESCHQAGQSVEHAVHWPVSSVCLYRPPGEWANEWAICGVGLP